MKGTIAEQILSGHLVSGRMDAGEEIGLRIDQTLTQDATGTMVYLEFDSLGLDEAKPERAVSYIDHNLIQSDYRNADDHAFLRSCAAKYGVILSPAGNGVSHHVHRQRWGVPGKTLVGSDSHTTTGGAIGMLAMGAGGIEVAMAMAGMPYYITTPEIWGIYVEGAFQPWVSGKDLILELARRFTVKGGIGRILEFHGPGVANIDISSRATIANMSVDIGATACIFPSDDVTRAELARNGREDEWMELSPAPDAEYEHRTDLRLDDIEPLVACPSSPDNVRPAAELTDTPAHQVLIGSSANGSYRDIMIAARAIEGREKHSEVDLEINPGSRQELQNVIQAGGLQPLINAGARINEAGCLGCIGMGQAPATGANSLRTFPRNFKGRSGTKDDFVYLCSPEVAVASAITGHITDPRTLGEAPRIEYPANYISNQKWFIFPPEKEARASIEVKRGPNITEFPQFDEMEDELAGPVLLKVGDNISTDTIMPAGTRALPYRSNIPEISKFVFEAEDEQFFEKAWHASRDEGKHGVIVGGENYGQGSSREHAALAPRYLGVRVKIAKSFARIHKSNLINFGILPLIFDDPADYDRIDAGAGVKISGVQTLLEGGHREIPAEVDGRRVKLILEVSPRHRRMLLAGGAVNLARREAEANR